MDSIQKQTPWSSMVRPLPLPADCPSTTTCAVELTLLTGAKAAFISSYLPQPLEEHARVCKALANLPQALPHQILILGGDLVTLPEQDYLVPVPELSEFALPDLHNPISLSPQK